MKFVWSMQHSNILVFFRGKIVDKITIFSYWFQAFSKKSYSRWENERANTHINVSFFFCKKKLFCFDTKWSCKYSLAELISNNGMFLQCCHSSN